MSADIVQFSNAPSGNPAWYQPLIDLLMRYVRATEDGDDHEAGRSLWLLCRRADHVELSQGMDDIYGHFVLVDDDDDDDGEDVAEVG